IDDTQTLSSLSGTPRRRSGVESKDLNNVSFAIPASGNSHEELRYARPLRKPTSSPPSPSRPLLASPYPEAPQDSSLPAPPPAYRPIPAMEQLLLRDHPIRQQA